MVYFNATSDGDASPQRLHGLTAEGRLLQLAANHIVLKGERNGIEGDL